MNNSYKVPRLKTGLKELLSVNKDSQGKLYVAYRNNTLIDRSSSFIDNGNSQLNNYNNRKASVFSTTGGFYYIDGKPANLLQDDEAMYYEVALSEYY